VPHYKTEIEVQSTEQQRINCFEYL